MHQVGALEEMYQSYKDVAAFYIVYIREAHASDGRSKQRIGKNLGIKNHTSYEERCEVAQRLATDKKLTIPCLIDGFDNKVNDAYRGWPTRVFLVRTDGKLGVAGGRGPWGLKPALSQTREWLAAFKESGQEPELPAPADATESDEESNQASKEGENDAKEVP